MLTIHFWWFAGLQNILIENEELLSEKNELARELREMEAKMKEFTRFVLYTLRHTYLSAWMCIYDVSHLSITLKRNGSFLLYV